MIFTNQIKGVSYLAEFSARIAHVFRGQIIT